jgi:hypothetical protein
MENMKTEKNIPILHPFFLAAYFVLFLYSYNISQISINQLARPLLITFFIALALTFLFGYLTKEYQQGGLSASIFLFLFFSYGHVYHLLELYAPQLANEAILGIMWLIILLLMMLFKWKLRDISQLTKILNLCTAVLLILPILNISLFLIQSYRATTSKLQATDNLSAATTLPPGKLPDIYYIIVDGYGRSDVLQELFQYDNSEFISYLKEKAFTLPIAVTVTTP